MPSDAERHIEGLPNRRVKTRIVELSSDRTRYRWRLVLFVNWEEEEQMSLPVGIVRRSIPGSWPESDSGAINKNVGLLFMPMVNHSQQ